MTPPTKEPVSTLLLAHEGTVLEGMEPFNPFGSPPWLKHFVDQIVDDRQIAAAMVIANTGNQPTLLPLSFDPRSAWQLNGLTNYYASLHTPFHTLAADRVGAARALVAQLQAEYPACSILKLAPLNAEAADTAVLRAALGSAGWFTKSYFCFGNWYLPCEGLAFADYMKARDSQLFNTWSRKAKKFKPDGKGEARLQLVTRPEDVAVAMNAFDTVYAKSWKDAEPYPDFVRGWAAVCAHEGWLRLGIAWVGDVPIAAQFWFTVAGRAYIFKLAYDEAFTKWSAGTVLTAYLMQQALDVDKVVEVDYLTGDDPYKKAWMSHRRERIGLLACKLRSLRGFLAASREVVAALARRWLPK